MNPWLKEIKKAKSVVKSSRVILYQGSCETLIPESSRPISPVIEYDFKDLKASTVSGFYVVDISGFVIHNQRFQCDIVDVFNKITIDLSKMKVNNKWNLEQLIAVKDY